MSVSRAWTISTGAVVAAILALSPGVASADRIKNPTAVYSGLDKNTGRTVSFEVAVDETVQFGALQMTPRVCYSRPPTENPNTTAFVEVDEITLESKYHRVFSGWMFASSPGLHGLEHPVYDIWLIECKGGTEVIAEPKEAPEESQPAALERPRRQVERRDIIMEPERRAAPVQPPAERRFFPSGAQ